MSLLRRSVDVAQSRSPIVTECGECPTAQLPRLVERGLLEAADVAAFTSVIAEAMRDERSVLCTPILAEIILQSCAKCSEERCV